MPDAATDFEAVAQGDPGPPLGDAGTFGPNVLDPTFGPELRFLGIPAGMKPNRPPSDGLQFFGLVRVDTKTRGMTVELRNLAGERIYRIELPGQR